jgi:hypothetical protein
MEERTLPDWIDGFMLLSEDSEPPILFRKWTAISTIAAALQRKVRVDFGISLTFYPNFYIVLVGPPSTGKGTAMSYAADIIREIPAITLSAQATSLQALIRRMQQVNATDIELDTGSTQYHSSITIFSNEFTVFLGYHNRELITALCDWYDCHPKWTYDTIKRDKETITGVWVNLLGGTTPENIQTSFPPEAIGGGLSSRIIFVNEEKKSKLIVFSPVTQKQLELQACLIHDLEQIALMSGRYRFTRSFMELYTHWVHKADADPPFRDPKFDGYCGRRRNHLISLAMVCAASKRNKLIMDHNDLQRAIELLYEVEVKMGTVFRGIGKSDIASQINDAIIFIQNSATSEIPVWEFSRHFEGNMDKFIMNRVLDTLEASHYIDLIRKPGLGQIIMRRDVPDVPDESV